MASQKGGTAAPTKSSNSQVQNSKLGSVHFSVDKRYTPVKVVGTGAYGVVCEAIDNRTGKKVAIKKIPKAFEILTIAKRTLLEVKLLKHFHKHDNIISLLDIMKPPKPPTPFNDVYVVMDLLESDLHRIIHSKQTLSEEHIRYFTYQLCRGLKYIHSANVLHRDIKPSNLLLTSTCDLKICDFGMARGLTHSPQKDSSHMTAYVATRWYRAPEVMLSFKEYTQAIDVWSVGCILAEMFGRQYLFAGTNYVNQLNLILNLLGTPGEDLIMRIGTSKAQQYLRSLKPKGPVELSTKYPSASPEAIDFIKKILLFDPTKRLTMAEALNHPFLAKYRNPKDEPTCSPFDFEFEQKNFTAAELKKSLMEEIQDFYSPSMKVSTKALTSAPVRLIKHGTEKAIGVKKSVTNNKRPMERAPTYSPQGVDNKRQRMEMFPASIPRMTTHTKPLESYLAGSSGFQDQARSTLNDTNTNLIPGLQKDFKQEQESILQPLLTANVDDIVAFQPNADDLEAHESLGLVGADHNNYNGGMSDMPMSAGLFGGGSKVGVSDINSAQFLKELADNLEGDWLNELNFELSSDLC
eukprot:m.57941 g.57941  ORF g.57941 m.57941 type:complete len:578 (+) comp11142_c0_seq4:179-1912(+)